MVKTLEHSSKPLIGEELGGKMNKFRLFLISLFLISLNYIVYSEEVQIPGYVPKDGIVPNAETAIKIAETIWLPIYGNLIKNSKPYIATLSNGVWIVEGTLKKNEIGGVPYIEIKKSDCKIIKVIHSK